MVKKSDDVSKTITLVLIILTVIISATSTWVLITNSLGSEPAGSGFNNALIHLRILRGDAPAPLQSDTNAGDVKLFIADKGG